MSLGEEECEEEDKNLSLGMPMKPQEDDEQLENEERELPPSLPMDEGNLQYIIDDKLCFYDSDDDEEYNLCLMRILLIIILKMTKTMV